MRDSLIPSAITTSIGISFLRASTHRVPSILIASILAGYPLQAQEKNKSDIDIQALADELLSYQDEDLNYEDLYENLLQLLSNPLNINTATAEQLRSLHILSEHQVQQLLRYRNENGELLAEYELQAVPGFDQLTINRLIPFIDIENPKTQLDKKFIRRMVRNENAFVVTRFEHLLESKRGFNEKSDAQFLGDRGKYYTRFRTSVPNDFSFGFTVEQDAGEAFRWSPTSRQYVFDFISFHGQVQNKGKLKNLVVGDYQMQAGQGLVLGGTFGLGKGGETITTARRSSLLQLPFTSVTENAYLRGISATYQLPKNLQATGFISHAHRDASASSDSSETQAVSSLLTSGLHRNAKELNNRKHLGETIYGGIISYQQKLLDIGIIYQHTLYDKRINRVPSVYNQFAFNGRENTNVSLYGSYTLVNFNVFGEVAKSLHHGYGTVIGAIGSLAPALDIALVYRNYQPDFYSFYSNAFGESSATQNERGFYWGLKYKFRKRYELSGYMDFFEFPWLRFRQYKPSVGYETLLRFQYQPSRSGSLFIQARQEAKESNVTGDFPLHITDVGIKRNLTIHSSYVVGRILQLKTRVQCSDYQLNNDRARGMTIVQDVTADAGKIKVTGRYALFDTDDFSNRQYVAERDMWLAYSFPAYNGKGLRQYVLVQYDVNKRYTLWFRYAHTRVANEESIGSGLDETEGPDRNEVKFQVRIRL